MSILDTLKADGTDVGSFFKKLVSDVITAKNIWQAISSPQTRALIVTLAKDVITTVKDGELAANATGMNLALDLQTVNDIKQLVADAKGGDGVLKTDLALLGITL